MAAFAYAGIILLSEYIITIHDEDAGVGGRDGLV